VISPSNPTSGQQFNPFGQIKYSCDFQRLHASAAAQKEKEIASSPI